MQFTAIPVGSVEMVFRTSLLPFTKTYSIFSLVKPTAIYTRSYKIISNRYYTSQDRHGNFVGCVEPTAPKILYAQLHYVRFMLRH